MTGRTKKVVIERTLTQADFDAFAALSGDDNPIHVDADFSARTSFGRTVAHGMLLYTVLRGLIDKLAPGARQLSQEIKFPAPAFAGDLLHFEAGFATDTEHRVQMHAVRVSDGAFVLEGSCVLTERVNSA